MASEQACLVSECNTVRELVACFPQTVRVFEQFGIDYCCGGRQDLRTACVDCGASLPTLLEALRGAIEMPVPPGPASRNWRAATAAELADHIENQHHTYLKSEIPRLEDLLARVIRAHEQAHGQMLRGVQSALLELDHEIMQHLLREEHELFPLIRQVEAYSTGHGMKPTGHLTLTVVLVQLEGEHESAGKALADIRQLTDNFALPGDACASFSRLYAGLDELDRDLREHIHLENNILFPRAMELEKTAGR